MVDGDFYEQPDDVTRDIYHPYERKEIKKNYLWIFSNTCIWVQ